MDEGMSDRDRLSLQRIAGGSVINDPPLFSEDGEILFILRASHKQNLTGYTNTVRAYSTNTGEWLRDLEEANGRIVNIQNMPSNSMMIVGCTEYGEIVTWKHRSGTTASVVKMLFPEIEVAVETFNIISFDNNSRALITWTCRGGLNVETGIFDLITGNQIESHVLPLEGGAHKVAVSRNNLKIIAAIQNCRLFVARLRDRRTKDSNKFVNAASRIFTSVVCHPEDNVVAVSDESGKIFVYYDIFKKGEPANEILHWHHNCVETISFTSSGSVLYSGGAERVLVGWTGNQKKFKPRMNGRIVHLVVSPDNQKIAVCTDDNGILLVDPQFDDISVIQNFVRVGDDKTPWPNLPLGLQVDPRTGYIVLNGRIGQVQFYSPYDKTFFNLDTTMENRLSLESDNTLFNTRVTHVACNVDWLVTAECLNDLEHTPEVRLKFWSFDAAKKTYILATQIETPHVGGVTALQFSSALNVDKLLCASCGLDKKLKIWSLEESEVVDSRSPLDKIKGETVTETRKYWVNLETTSYKDLAVNSLAFSPDGSTLAVGFGNTLCIYIPETLRLKTVLSTPSGQDGSLNKLIVNKSRVPSASKVTKTEQNHRTQLNDERDRIRQLIRAFLENDNEKLLDNIVEKTKKFPRKIDDERTNVVPLCDLSVEEKETLFKGIVGLNELNFYQKLELFQKIGIPICLPADLENKFQDYIRDNMSVKQKEIDLMERCKRLPTDSKFIGHWKLQNYLTRRSDAAVNGLHLKNVTFDDDVMISSSRKTNHDNSVDMEIDGSRVAKPVRKVATIKHVSFATGDCSHFVIVCTENRLLIWNLLTLRLHASFKLSIRQIVVDPCTSLVAAFTVFEELYVFEPSKPYVLYQRKNMPKTVGAVWLPRRHPKHQSLDVDWQSISQLFFLTREQEMLYLVADNDEDLLASKGASLQEMDKLEPQTQFGAMIARQTTNDTVLLGGQRNFAGGLIGEPTKNCVKSFTNLQTHTMAPVSLLTNGFLTSLLSNEIDKTRNTSRVPDHTNDMDVDDADVSDAEENAELNRRVNQRKEWARLDNVVSKSSEEELDKTNKTLGKMIREPLTLNFRF